MDPRNRRNDALFAAIFVVWRFKIFLAEFEPRLMLRLG